MTKQKHFDAETFWDKLRPDLQRQLGLRLIGIMVTYDSRDGGQFGDMTDPTDVANAYFRAECEAFNQIDALLDKHAPLRHAGDPPWLPPKFLLPPSCRICGCTDDRACEGGCSWVEPDLCSQCAEREKSIPTIAAVQQAVTSDYGLELVAILGPSRRKAVTVPRQVAMFLAAELTGKETTVIGRAFNRDRTTITHAIDLVGMAVTADARLALRVKGLRERLQAGSAAQ